MKLYLDTSVYGGFYDEGMEASIDLIDAVNERDIEVVTSYMILEEFDKAPIFINNRLNKILDTINKKLFVNESDEVSNLADQYVHLKVLPINSFDDAQHIAIAVLSEVDYIISWNFTHMVGRNELYKEVNKKLNLKQIDILKPDDFLNNILKWKSKNNQKP